MCRAYSANRSARHADNLIKEELTMNKSIFDEACADYERAMLSASGKVHISLAYLDELNRETLLRRLRERRDAFFIRYAKRKS